MHMTALKVTMFLTLIIVLLSSTKLFTEGATIPPTNYTTELTDHFTELKAKVGRKERCRHGVRKEVQRFSHRVQTLTDTLWALQQNVMLIRKQQQQQILQLELLMHNLTEQRRWQKKTSADIEQLQSQHRVSAIPQTTEKLDFPKDCDDIYTAGGMRFPGTYEMQIQPKENSSIFKVLCEPINDAGWIVIQSRYDGSENFKRKWHDYKKGFGKVQSELWLGNERIHHITSKGNTTLRVELEEFSGRKHWAEYSHFKVDNEASNYTIHISGYSGNAGDALKPIDGQQFSTPDRDHDKAVFDNCANQYSAGWWYKTCSTSNINGQYLDQSTHGSFFHDHGIVWQNIDPYKTLKNSRLLLKPTSKDAH